MKVLLYLVYTFALLGAVLSDCSYKNTIVNSLTVTTSTLTIQSMSPLYADFEVVWDGSPDDTITMNATFCGSSIDDFNTFQADFSETSEGVQLFLRNNAAPDTPVTEAPTVAPTVEPPVTETPPATKTNAASASAPGLVSLIFVSLTSLFFLPKNRLSFALVLVAVVLMMNAQASPLDVPAPKITIKISVPTRIQQFCVKGQCTSRTPTGGVTDYVNIFNKRFAALTSACAATAVPEGWSVAESTDTDSLMAVYYNNWGKYNVIMKGGNSYANQQKTANAIAFGKLIEAAGKVTVSADICQDSVVLITQSFMVPEPAKAIVGTPYISAVNSVTFNGYDYAVADNTPYSSSEGKCQTFNVFVNTTSEWQLAPNDGASLIVIQKYAGLSFGADCVVLSDGNAFQPTTAPCNSNPSAQLQQTPYAPYNGNIFSVDCSKGNKRILMRRVSSATPTWASQATITTMKDFGGKNYAVIDNSNEQCQAHAMKLPTGWRIVNSTELLNFLTPNGYVFPAYCYASTSTALLADKTAGQCSLITKIVDGVAYYATSTCGKVLIIQDVAVASEFEIGLKVLLLSSTDNDTVDVQLALAKTMFQATGVLYDHVPLRVGKNFAHANDGALELLDSAGKPKYYAIVLTGYDLTYTDASDNNVVAITAEQRTQLNTYKYQYGVRMVALNAYPDGTYVTALESASAPVGMKVGLDQDFAKNTPAAVGGLITNATYDMQLTSPAGSASVYYTSVTIKNTAAVVPVARMTTKTGTVTKTDKIGAVLITKPDGTQEMVFYFGNSVTFPHGPLFANVWLNWVTKGLWIGNRRVYLTPQIDDLFLSTEEYGNGIARRMTDTDLQETADFFTDLKANHLPGGSSLTCEFGVNNEGVVCGEEQTDPLDMCTTVNDALFSACQRLRDSFFWESHTWSHLNLTCPEGECLSKGTTTYAQARPELDLNNEFTNKFLFKDQGGVNYTHWSPSCMITPAISGLFNPEALRALYDSGMTCVVGDNSRPELVPANKYHGLWTTTAANGYEGIFIVPRFATEIYFDTAYPQYAVQEFNDRWGINGKLQSLGKDFTLDEIIAQEALRTVNWLMLFRHDPYMFHQANMLHFDYARQGESSQRWSLFTLWVRSIVDQYNTMMSFPILNVKHEDLKQMLWDRMETDECGLSATATVRGNVVSEVKLSSGKTCWADVTGLSTCGVNSMCTAQTYGPDKTVHQQMIGASTKTYTASNVW